MRKPHKVKAMPGAFTCPGCTAITPSTEAYAWGGTRRKQCEDCTRSGHAIWLAGRFLSPKCSRCGHDELQHYVKTNGTKGCAGVVNRGQLCGCQMGYPCKSDKALTGLLR